jgi:hypothetical protein
LIKSAENVGSKDKWWPPRSVLAEVSTRVLVCRLELETDMDDILDRAATTLALKMMIDEGQPLSQSKLGMAELYRFLVDPTFELTHAQMRTLFTNADLRRAFRSLKMRLNVIELPIVAAASDSVEVFERRFAGGLLRLTPSKIGRQYYLRIHFDPAEVGARVTHLVLNTSDGTPIKLTLPRRMLDLADEHQAAIFEALRNPMTTGDFIVRPDD